MHRLTKVYIAILVTALMLMLGINVAISQQANVSASPFQAVQTGSGNTTSAHTNGTLYISPGPSPAYVDNFNPFNMWTSPAGIMSLFYEPLFQINTYNGTAIPWLATKYTWNSNDTVLTLTLRQNVQFSNGMAFNSSDVLFTFNLQKKLFGEWGAVSNISAPGPYTVKFTFSIPNVPYFFYIGSNFILPKLLWQNVTSPTKKIVTDPIGTGPYLLSSFSSQKIVLSKNPKYWQSNEPHINSIVYIDYTSNNALTLALSQGLVDWAPVFAPNITSLFVDKNPHYNHYFFPSGQPVTLIANDLKWPMDLPYFRQALSMSINRTQVSNIGEYGYEKPANGADILQQQMFWLNSTNTQLANSLVAFNPTKALSLLGSHGFTMKSGRLYGPNGTEVPTMNLITVAGYTDWDADISIIANNLKDIGLNVNIVTPTSNEVSSDIATGNFTLAEYTVTGTGPNPWYDYTGLFGNITPIGHTATVNEERWNSTGTGFTSLYNNFSQVSNSTLQKQIINKMASIVLSQMPMIPLVYSADWYEYVNSSIGGFPSASNDYWIPLPWFPGPMEVVTLHLYDKVNSPSAPAISFTTYYIVGGVIAAAVAIAGGAVLYRKSRHKKEDEE